MENHQYNTRRRKKRHLNDKNDSTVKECLQMEKMSQDLFSDNISLSQEVTSLQRAEREQLKKQITDFTWVQCDDIDCQKWRRIPVSESEGLSQKQWYCHMGTDPGYNSCMAQEEDHHAYDKLARKLGLNYVMSQLSEGTLVWAKMMGYCRWPALVTGDPACGISCEWGKEGEPQFYHVEYLGTKHSHGWIRADKLTLYGHREEDNPQKRKCRTKQMALTMANNKIQRKKYNKVPVDLAIAEADRLICLNVDQRLALCTFKYSEKVEEEHTDGRKRRIKKESQTCCQLCGGDSKRESVRRCKSDRMSAALLQQVDAVVPKFSSRDTDIHGQSDVFQFEKLKFKNTLVDKSKEEKFKIDVEMYKRNEKAFDHDLRRFMDRNKVAVSKIPVWQRVPIGLFQMFMSVFEQGGYEKVCMSRCWAAVYKELTELPVAHASVGGVAKSYYQRNLYPYELYITGGDYQAALDNIKNKKKPKRSVTLETSKISKVPESDKQLSDPSAVDDCLEPDNDIELGLEEDVDLEAMLTQLESYSKMCQLEEAFGKHLPRSYSYCNDCGALWTVCGVMPHFVTRSTTEDEGEQNIAKMLHIHNVDAAQKRLGIDITYHDDSSGSLFSPGIKLADTASEFGLSNLPDEEAQMVPSQSNVHMESDPNNSSQSDQILQELLVLDDEFQQLEQEMSAFL